MRNDGNISIKSSDIDIFETQYMAAATMLDFRNRWIWYILPRWISVYWVVYQIWFKFLI